MFKELFGVAVRPGFYYIFNFFLLISILILLEFKSLIMKTLVKLSQNMHMNHRKICVKDLFGFINGFAWRYINKYHFLFKT
jgi:hypothetical protein